MNRIHLFLLSLITAATAFAVVVSIVLVAPAAFAVQAIGHGYGYTWASDGHTWLGSHRLADNNTGFCLQVSKHPPEGDDLTYVRGNTLGWYNSDDAARLAYIGRTWSGSTDPDWAAAAQIATWAITGLGGHDVAYYAARANAHAGAVQAIVSQILSTVSAPDGASHWVSAGAYLDLPPTSGGTIRTELFVDYAAGGVTQLAPHRHTGTLTLVGAHFDDGSTTRSVQNGDTIAITPDGSRATSNVSASVTYRDLPYGDDFWVAQDTSGGQSLLVHPPAPASATGVAYGTEVSPLPFSPQVATRTSEQVSLPGNVIRDELELSVATPTPPGSALIDWGVYRDTDGSFREIPVTITSTLYGPLDAAPSPLPDAPPRLPIACIVETVATRGPVTYETPECRLPEVGYYVWVDAIDPSKTPAAQGGDRLRPWRSPFGAATETTFASTTPPPPPPPVTPTPPAPAITPPVVVPPVTPPDTTPPVTPPSTTPPTTTPPSTPSGTTPPPPTSSPSPSAAPALTSLTPPSTPRTSHLPDTGLTPPPPAVTIAAAGTLLAGLSALLLARPQRRRSTAARRT